MKTLIIILSIILAIILVLVLSFMYLIKNAPEGYQDKDGYHNGVEGYNVNHPDSWDKIYEEELQKRIEDFI